MKRKAFITALLSGLVAATWAGPTVPGKDVAPVRGSDTEAARAGGQTASAVQNDRSKTAPDAAVSTTDKLKRIKIPEIEFQDATLAGAVEFLVRAGKDGDTSSPQDQRGINIALSVPADVQARTIQLQARNITLFDALRMITKLAGVRYEIVQGVVMVVPAREGGADEMNARSYTINQAMLPGIRATTAKAYFEKMGVVFPEGATATYNPGAGKIMVINTDDNLKTMDQIVAGLGGQAVDESAR